MCNTSRDIIRYFATVACEEPVQRLIADRESSFVVLVGYRGVVLCGVVTTSLSRAEL